MSHAIEDVANNKSDDEDIVLQNEDLKSHQPNKGTTASTSTSQSKNDHETASNTNATISPCSLSMHQDEEYVQAVEMATSADDLQTGVNATRVNAENSTNLGKVQNVQGPQVLRRNENVDSDAGNRILDSNSINAEEEHESLERQQSRRNERSTVGPLPAYVSTLIADNPTQPPSYTSVEIPRPSVTFLPPVPPPSYGEVMGIDSLRSPRPPQPLVVNVPQPSWTSRSQPAYCRFCHAMILTRVTRKPCAFTHMAAGMLFLFLCWPCCVVPYFINGCLETKHSCPSCNNTLGVYTPII